MMAQSVGGDLRLIESNPSGTHFELVLQRLLRYKSVVAFFVGLIRLPEICFVL